MNNNLGLCLAGGGVKGADYVLKIKSNKIGLLDMKKIDYLYELGYMKTKSCISKILKIN